MSTIVLTVLAVPVASAEQVPVIVHVGDAPAPADPPAGEPGPEPEATSAPPPAPADPAAPPDSGSGPPPAGEQPEPAPAPEPRDVPQASEPVPSPLPRTGGDALRLLRDAAAALAAGLLVLLAARPSSQKERP